MSAHDGLGRPVPQQLARRPSVDRPFDPPADFPEGGHPCRDRRPVSDFFTQAQKIGEPAHATARGDDPECAGTSFIQVRF
jgi:hypothetical protein